MAFLVKIEVGPYNKHGQEGGNGGPAAFFRAPIDAWPGVGFYAKRRPEGYRGPAAGGRAGSDRPEIPHLRVGPKSGDL